MVREPGVNLEEEDTPFGFSLPLLESKEKEQWSCKSDFDSISIVEAVLEQEVRPLKLKEVNVFLKSYYIFMFLSHIWNISQQCQTQMYVPVTLISYRGKTWYISIPL